MNFIATFFISGVVTLLLTPFLIRVARKYDFLDYPSELKTHLRPTPLLGGAAVFLGFLAAIFLSTQLFHLP